MQLIVARLVQLVKALNARTIHDVQQVEGSEYPPRQVASAVR